MADTDSNRKFQYTKGDYDIYCNAPLNEETLTKFPENIFNVALYNKWINYTYPVYKITLPITETDLYKMNESGKLLAFGYALIDTQIPGSLQTERIVIFRVIPGYKIEIEEEFINAYSYPEKLTKLEFLQIPVNIFKARRLYIILHQLPDDVCCRCKGHVYMVDNSSVKQCLNDKCKSYFMFNFSTIPVFNKYGPIIQSLDYILQNIALKNNEQVLKNVCLKCANCKICLRNKKGEKCKRHVYCAHTTKINKKTTKNKYHCLNMLAIKMMKETEGL